MPQALQKVNINIIDFNEHMLRELSSEKQPQGSSTDHLSARVARAKKLKFPTVKKLGIYSKIMGRVFPLQEAKIDGTAVFLLKTIRHYFDSYGMQQFLEQAHLGRGFLKARALGADEVRKLFMSRQKRESL